MRQQYRPARFTAAMSSVVLGCAAWSVSIALAGCAGGTVDGSLDATLGPSDTAMVAPDDTPDTPDTPDGALPATDVPMDALPGMDDVAAVDTGCPSGYGMLQGACTPGCGTAGGNTCSSTLTPCTGRELLTSFDCRFCCNAPVDGPPPKPPAGCMASASGSSAIWTCTADGASRQRCTAGAVQTEMCPHGCTSQPLGTDDYCTVATCTGSASGNSPIWTCTADHVSRQRCASGAVQTEMCPHGCTSQPLGTDDYCTVTTCAGSASGTSPIWTCTADHTARQRCVSGTVATEPCAGGCTPMPLGTDDVCAASCAGSASGTSPVYTCTADHTARQRCMGGGVQTERCPAGCLGRPLGTDDVCASGCAGSASGTSPIWTCTGDFSARQRCVGGAVQSEGCPHGCASQPPGTDDLCGSAPTGGTGEVSCGYPQWWTAPYSWSPGYYGIRARAGYRWDNDLAEAPWTPVQLRHASQLVTEAPWPWGWMPEFIDQVTGEHFAFLHLQPSRRLVTTRGHIYPAGTLVGYSGGNTPETGYCIAVPGCGTPICGGSSPQCVYSTGAHLCVQTVRSFHTAFPATRDACR